MPTDFILSVGIFAFWDFACGRTVPFPGQAGTVSFIRKMRRIDPGAAASMDHRSGLSEPAVHRLPFRPV